MFFRKTLRVALRNVRYLSSRKSAKRDEIARVKSKQRMVQVGGVVATVIAGGAIHYNGGFGEQGPFAPLWNSVNNLLGDTFSSFTEPSSNKLLPDVPKIERNPYDGSCRPTLVLDLEQTLTTSSWDRKHGWRTVKRPGVDAFLREMSELYEIVIFSTTPWNIAAPWVQGLDPAGMYVRHQLFRDATLYTKGTYIKDLSKLNRDLSKVVLVDDEATSFQLQPENGILVPKFEDGTSKKALRDTTLIDLIPFLRRLAQSKDVREELQKYDKENMITAIREENEKRTAEEEEEMRKGLGGVIRRRQNGLSEVELRRQQFLKRQNQQRQRMLIAQRQNQAANKVLKEQQDSMPMFPWQAAKGVQEH
eukprot:g6107.t1